MTDPEQGGNRRGAIAGLAIAVVLLVVGVWLAHQLTAASKMQDCLMSERTIRELRAEGMGILKIGRTVGVGTSVVQRVVQS